MLIPSPRLIASAIFVGLLPLPAAEPAAVPPAPTPVDPYPINAAGWGAEAEHGRYVSRWVEDWTTLRSTGHAPALKAWPIAGDATLTLGAEVRLRLAEFDRAPLISGHDYEQTQLRGIVNGDLRFTPHFRAYAELGTGYVAGRRAVAAATYQNDASLQQGFVEARDYFGATLGGIMIGRQEFADGPRQIVSLGDGPNLHRTWNGIRLYAHQRWFRVGGFFFRATRAQPGFLDETIDYGERLHGLNASLNLVADHGTPLYLDPFWIHSEKPSFRSGGRTGLDDRDTLGARFWGRRGDVRFDWTIAHQMGRFIGRKIDAWGVFAVQSVTVSQVATKPRLGLRFDAASGGGAYGNATTHAFHPLYASTGYLGEGSFLSLSNLLLVAPTVSFAPTRSVTLDAEYDFTWRRQSDDAAYAGQMRAYPGTPGIAGREIGRLLRLGGNWEATETITLAFDFEHFDAGEVLRNAQLPSGSYLNLTATFRY